MKFIPNYNSNSQNKIFLFPLVIILVAFSVIGCEEEEDNQIAQAQQCLDGLRDSDNAQVCINKVNGLNSAEANIIRCHASFHLGGITTTSIVAAVSDYESAPAADKEATLLVALSQTPDSSRSNTTYSYCAKTGVPGLVYMATISNMGTIVKEFGANPDPATAMAACAGGTSCEEDVIGEMAVNLYDIYCVGGASQTQICTDINSSINNVGAGNYQAIGEELLQYFAN
jgi:hypothetical protein